jgi:putative ABC transport system permease protein
MRYSETIFLALRSIWANKLRTSLTMLIIAIGIMALIAILTSIDGLKASISTNFASMGTNTFSLIQKGTGIRIGGRGPRKVSEPISFEQAYNFKKSYTIPSVVSVSVFGSSIGVIKYSSKETKPNVSIIGVDENYMTTAGYDLAVGRNLRATEAENGKFVCIIGQDLVDILFAGNPFAALGRQVKIKNVPYSVIGVLKAKGSSASFSGDKSVLIPITCERMFFRMPNDNYSLSINIPTAEAMQEAISEAEGLMRRVRGLRVSEENDFEVEKSDGLIDTIVENTATIQLAAVFIGLITLFGAAVGLMNIMLVSVTERTREIGILKSLGATRRSILNQFLTEAILICQIGGLVGIFWGILAGNGVSLILGSPFMIPWAWILLGLVLCFIVGLVSGIYPALRASKLDPIESLRYE